MNTPPLTDINPRYAAQPGFKPSSNHKRVALAHKRQKGQYSKMQPVPPPGSASTLVVLLLLLLLCLVPPCVRSSPGCPFPCSCKWKSGKQTAECGNQNITSVPTGINPDVQVLDLSENNIGELPSLIFQNRKLVNLQKIYLVNCAIRWIASDAFYQLSNLVELDLTGNHLVDVPTSIFNDTFLLRRLLMGKNPIRRLSPNTFGNLTFLTFLDLSNCQIDQINPGAFRGLRNMDTLLLNGNKLTVLNSNVLSNLPILYSFILSNNPWHCDCNLKDLRVWISNNNIPTNIPPRCQTPRRLRDVSWISLAIQEFACMPVVESSVTIVNALRGENATFECIVKAVPDATLSWQVDGVPVQNISTITDEEGNIIGEKYVTANEGDVSHLTVTEVDLEDAGTFVCVAENPAGVVESNFTLAVIYAPPVPVAWGNAQIIGIALGLFLAIVIVVVVACIVLLRYRTIHATESKFNGVGILKQLASKRQETGVEITAEKQNDLTTTDKTPRQETGSSGYGSDQHTPDLTNKANEANNANGPTYSTKAFLYSHPVHDSLTRETLHLQEQCYQGPVFAATLRRAAPQENYHGYSNEFPNAGYQQPYDALSTTTVSLSNGGPNHSSTNPSGSDNPRGTNGFHCDTERCRTSDSCSECASSVKDESYHSFNSPAHPAVVVSQVPNGGPPVTWKRTPLVVPNSAHFELPPDRRYSPDEGYAEEALEGTEV